MEKGLYGFPKRTNKIAKSYYFNLDGEIKVASGDTDFISTIKVRLINNQIYCITQIRYKHNGGTSFTFQVQKNGVLVDGTSLTSSTAWQIAIIASTRFMDGDEIGLVVGSVTGTPKNAIVEIDGELTF